MVIHPDEEILAGGNEHFRAISVVAFDDEVARVIGLLEVEAAPGS